jgi:putative DNA primase/helicase
MSEHDWGRIIRDAAHELFGSKLNAKLSSATVLKFGTNGSLVVNIGGKDAGTWYDFEAKEGSGAIELIKRCVPGENPWDWLKRLGIIEPDLDKFSTRTRTFDYRNAAAEFVCQKVRKERTDTGKKIKPPIWRRPDPEKPGGWIWNLNGIPRPIPLYGLPELLNADKSRMVLIVEGEPQVDLLRDWGFVATSPPNGANSWHGEYDELFRDRDVVVLPDNDPQTEDKKGKLLFHPDGKPKFAGQDHAETVARHLYGVARSVRVLMLPNLPEKGDVVDWKQKLNGTAEQLQELIDGQPPWKPPADEIGDDGILPPEFSEEALALKMASRHVDTLRYVSLWGKYFIWTGKYWRADEKREAFNLARSICREAAMIVPKEGLARTVASAKTRAAVLALTGEDKRIAMSFDQWDADPWLLNTPDGVVDLKTGKTRPALPTDYMTKITAVGPKGECPLWLEFLDTITGGDEELQKYLQRACGYMLTGLTVEHAMFFLYGLGGNGKSKFIEAISGIMGDYHTTAQIETFTMMDRGDRHPTELAQLRGARLVTSMETEEGRRWAESRIKSITGGDKISARFMRQDFFEFYPQFKLAIFGNHKPGLRTVDAAIKRRMNLWPFNVTIKDVDIYFGEKLRKEWEGILKWMIEGCLIWQREKLNPPAAVTKATEHYFEQEDSFKLWLDENCSDVRDKLGPDKKPNVFTPTDWLFYSWKRWAEKAGEEAGSKKKFTQRVEAEGYEPARKWIKDKYPRGFLGICLQGTAQSEAENGLLDLGGQ